MRLTQGPEERCEPGAVELGPGRVRRVFSGRASGDQLSPPILEMLREFFDNLVLARG